MKNRQNQANINWYPGHMAKTKRQIEEDLKLIDVVVEILDARIPISSKNPDVADLIKGKKIIEVLNKSDLSNSVMNKKWLEYYRKNNIEAVLTDSNSGKGMNEVIKLIEKVATEAKQKEAQKGRTGKSIRVLVIGIPNVGKSSFINRLSKKTSAKVGNRPGVTTQKQWIYINENIQLLDTPGILWPKLEKQSTALNLAFTGTIKEEILPITEIAYKLLKYLVENYRKNLTERYKIEEKLFEDIMSNEEENIKIYEIMQQIGKKRGCIIRGGEIDDDKTSKIILEDFKSGKLGNITLEKVERK